MILTKLANSSGFQQRIYEIMMSDIVPNIPQSERPTWTAAAQNWRLLYWDWAAPYNQERLPHVLTSDSIAITMPGHASKTVPNPLWKFSNPSGMAMVDSRMKDLRIARFSMSANAVFPVGHEPDKLVFFQTDMWVVEYHRWHKPSGYPIRPWPGKAFSSPTLGSGSERFRYHQSCHI